MRIVRSLSPRLAVHILSGAFLCLAADGAAALKAEPAKPALLPDRLLHCTLGRMTNVDPKKNQTNADIIYEGHHPFDLFLPGIPVRQGPPPDATEAADPVDPRTKIDADPDGLTAKFPNRFDRVVDLWPERVEMTTTINDPLVNLVIIDTIDPAKGTANLFMTQATDVATYDLQQVYSGTCSVTLPSK